MTASPLCAWLISDVGQKMMAPSFLAAADAEKLKLLDFPVAVMMTISGFLLLAQISRIKRAIEHKRSVGELSKDAVAEEEKKLRLIRRCGWGVTVIGLGLLATNLLGY